jgi:hypothetical protein
MANEILLANAETPTDVISSKISRALTEKIVVLPHVQGEDLPVGTKTKLARKDGDLGLAITVAEVDNYTYSSASEYSESSVSLTIGKHVIASKITIEAEDFGGISDQKIIAKQGNSLGRTLDNEVKALADGFSQVVSAVGQTLLIEQLLEAAYLIRAGNAATDGKRLVGFIDFKGRHQLDKQKLSASAPVFAVEGMISLLQSVTQPNGYCGTIPGVDLFECNGLPTAGGNRKSMVINPDLAFFGMYGTVRVFRKNPDSQGLFTEITSSVYSQVAELNDAAGVEVQSVQ